MTNRCFDGDIIDLVGRVSASPLLILIFLGAVGVVPSRKGRMSPVSIPLSSPVTPHAIFRKFTVAVSGSTRGSGRKHARQHPEKRIGVK